MIFSAFSFIIISTELSMVASQYSSRIVQYLPFLRTRYGRAIAYVGSGAVLSVLNNQGMSYIATSMITFGGMVYGLIAMQPGNPLDYRGF